MRQRIFIMSITWKFWTALFLIVAALLLMADAIGRVCPDAGSRHSYPYTVIPKNSP
jgi:hypothetical protein